MSTNQASSNQKLIVLYYLPSVAPCRSVVLAIRYLNITNIQYIVWRETVLDKSNPVHQAFKEKNPTGAIPFLDDNGLFISEPNAIINYLFKKYDPNSRLLGRSVKEKATIMSRMMYHVGTIMPLTPQMICPVLEGETDKISADHKVKLRRIFTTLDLFLQKTMYIASDELTVADFNFASIISSYLYYGFPILPRFPHIRKWYERCRTLPGFYENEQAAKKIGNLVRSKLSEPADL